MHTLYLQKCIYKVEKTEVNERAKIGEKVQVRNKKKPVILIEIIIHNKKSYKNVCYHLFDTDFFK